MAILNTVPRLARRCRQDLKLFSRVLVPLENYPTLGSQHAVEAGYIKTMLLNVTAVISFV